MCIKRLPSLIFLCFALPPLLRPAPCTLLVLPPPRPGMPGRRSLPWGLGGDGGKSGSCAPRGPALSATGAGPAPEPRPAAHGPTVVPAQLRPHPLRGSAKLRRLAAPHVGLPRGHSACGAAGRAVTPTAPGVAASPRPRAPAPRVP